VKTIRAQTYSTDLDFKNSCLILLFVGLYQLVKQQIYNRMRKQMVWPSSLAFSLTTQEQEEQEQEPAPDLPKGRLSHYYVFLNP
jgi:hypothetical protein